MTDSKVNEVTESNVAASYLVAFIYGDTSGLDDMDIALLEKFERETKEEIGEGFFTVTETEQECSFERCEVSGLQADCLTIAYVTL